MLQNVAKKIDLLRISFTMASGAFAPVKPIPRSSHRYGRHHASRSLRGTSEQNFFGIPTERFDFRNPPRSVLHSRSHQRHQRVRTEVRHTPGSSSRTPYPACAEHRGELSRRWPLHGIEDGPEDGYLGNRKTLYRCKGRRLQCGVVHRVYLAESV